jgi:NAD(P)-dependent dehydrogenase (short-subunit alcohol dehydrogenase family)
MEKSDSQIEKVAIITGGTAGLGLAMAKKFVEEGILTIVTGRDDTKLKETKELLGSLCVPLKMDMTKLEQIPTYIKEVTDKYGKIDILINNAGINLKKELTTVTDEEFQKILLTNLTSVFSISREVSKVMMAQKKGYIINISSMAAHYGLPKVIAYSASKAAIEGMTRSMAVELSPHGILVNCIAPGFIKTNMSSKALDSDPERKRRVLERTPMGTLGLPEDVANAAYFLVSNENKFITGAVIPVDGGNSVGF